MKKDAMSKKGSTKSNLVSNLRYEPKVLTFNKPIKVIEKEQVELRARNMLPSFIVSSELAKSINMHLLKGNQKEGVLFGTSHAEGRRPVTYLLDFLNVTQSVEEQNIMSKITHDECACATFSMVKANSWKMPKFRHEIQCCQDTLPQMPQSDQQNSQLSDLLQKLYLQLFRVGLMLRMDQQPSLNRYIFFPNINLRVRQTVLGCKYASNEILSYVMEPINSNRPFNTNYGFIMPDERMRFILIERQGNHFDNMPVIGTWIHAKNLIKRQTGAINPEKAHLIWSVITTYIRSQRFQKVSIFGAFRGVLVIFTPGEKKPAEFIFECQQDATSNRWSFAKSSNRKMDLKEQMIFDTMLEHTQLEQLLKEEQQEMKKMQKQPGLKKHISSPVRKQVKQPTPKRQFPSFSNNSFARSENDSRSLKEVCSSDKVSQKSYDERDLEIRVLKEKLEFYKSRCQDLQKSVLNYKANYQQLLSMCQMMPLMGHPPTMGHMGMVGMPTQPSHYYSPLYHSAVMHQPFLQQYASTPISQQSPMTQNPMTASLNNPMTPVISQLPSQVSMTQSYAFSRQQQEQSKNQQQAALVDSAFTKKQHIVQPSITEYKTPAHKVPIPVPASGNLVRVNLADQFSDGVTSPDSIKNDQNINTANIKAVTRQDMIENSPKFVLADISDLDNSKIQNNFHETSYQDNLELSFKGYAVSTPVPPLAPMTQPTSNNSIPSTSSSTSIKEPIKQAMAVKDTLKQPKYRLSLMDSYASDNQYHFTSELIRDKPKPDRCVDSDSDNQQLVSKISRRYFPRA